MRKITIAVAIAVMAIAVNGCDRLKTRQNQAEESSSLAASSTTADAEVNISPDAPDPDYLKTQLANERAQIAANPRLATRTGDTLTISYDDKAVAAFTAPYTEWRFAGTVKVTGADGKIDRLAVVYLEGGEIGWNVIVRRDGAIVTLDDEILTSPDGRVVASGYGGTDWSSPLRIVEWNAGAYPHIVKFIANCAPVAWQDKDHFTAGCVRDEDDSVLMQARVSRDAAGLWHLQETAQRLDGNKDHPTPVGLKWRSEVAKPDEITQASDTAAAMQKGYRRLADG